jgi:hypothetical protein
MQTSSRVFDKEKMSWINNEPLAVKEPLSQEISSECYRLYRMKPTLEILSKAGLDELLTITLN